MDDLISRQAVIKALDSINYFGWVEDSWKNVCSIIEQAPLVKPEQRWTSVTEQLPKIDMSYPHHDDYLVQYNSGDMDVASWSNVNRFCTDRVTEPHWNCAQFAEVIAWMPLPELWTNKE